MTKSDLSKIITELAVISDDIMVSGANSNQCEFTKAAIIKKTIKYCRACLSASRDDRISDSLSCQTLLLKAKMLAGRIDDERVKKLASKINCQFDHF